MYTVAELLEKIKETNPTSDHLRYYRIIDAEDERNIMRNLLPYLKDSIAAFHDLRGTIDSLKEFYLHTAGTGRVTPSLEHMQVPIIILVLHKHS